jgi:hypothetical protein
MTSLTHFDSEYQYFDVAGVQFYIDVEGRIHLTQAGLAQICEVDKSTISRYLACNAVASSKTAQVPVPQQPRGFGKKRTTGKNSSTAIAIGHAQIQSVILCDETTIIEALKKFKPDRVDILAQVALRKMFHELSGWNIEAARQLATKQFEAAYYVSMYNIIQFGKLAKLDMDDHFREMAEQKRSITRLASSIDLDVYMKTPAYPYRKQLDAIDKILVRHNYLEGFPEIKTIAPLMAILNQLAKLENQFGFPLPSVMVDDAKFAINNPELIFENIKSLGSLEGLGSNTVKGRAVIARLTSGK